MLTGQLTPGVQALAASMQAGHSNPIALGNYPAVDTVHANEYLRNLILGYSYPQGQFIADQVIPVLPVVNETDNFYVWDRSGFQRREQTLTPDRSAAREVRPTFSADSYRAERYALATSVSDRERRNSDDQLSLEMAQTMAIANLLRLDIEVRAAALLSKANTSGVTLSGTAQWNNASFTDGVTSSIEYRIDVAKTAIRQALNGREPTHIIIPDAVAKVMKRNATVRELIKYTQNDLLVNGDLPPTLWGLKVIIPQSMYTTDPEGTAEGSVTYSDVWGGTDVRVLYVNPNPAVMVPATAYQFRVSADDFAVSQWREDRRKLDLFEVSVTQDIKLTMSGGCYVIEDAIA